MTTELTSRGLEHLRAHIAVVVCALIGTLLPAAVGGITGVPEPVFHDEFSYLLGADTFASGRLTNPSPRLPEFFETVHVLVTPTYQSKYPPGQALVLAAGQRVFGDPIWGVWMGCGLFAGALCWMLQGWTSREWAFSITLMMSATLGAATYWAQSYWGGMLAAGGSALVLGGMRRIVQSPSATLSCVTAAGGLVLASTRPYEGALACLPVLAVLAGWLMRSGGWSRREKVKQVVLPATGVLLLGMGSMAVYNRAVTGDYWLAPYELHQRQYFHQGVFIFNALREPERLPPERVARFHRSHARQPSRGAELARQIVKNLVARLPVSLGPPFGFFLGPQLDRKQYRGIALWMVLLVVPALAALAKYKLVVGAGMAVIAECVAWRYLPHYPWPLAPGIVLLWLLRGKGTLWGNPWVRFSSLIILLVAAGQVLVWWWHPHYAAPIAPVVYLLLAVSLGAGAPRLANRDDRQLLGTVAVLLVLHLGALAFTRSIGKSESAVGGAENIQIRGDVLRRLEERGGRHLVFVRYEDGYSLHREWVYNGADLLNSPVVFAHDLGSRNSRLMQEYPERLAWMLTVSPVQVRLSRHSHPIVDR